MTKKKYKSKYYEKNREKILLSDSYVLRLLGFEKEQLEELPELVRLMEAKKAQMQLLRYSMEKIKEESEIADK